MKTSAPLLAAIALAVAGVGVMISLQAEGTAEVAEGKPTKSARHRLPDAVRSASETMRDLNSADRRGLRDWAGGLDDKELHRLAMSFLQRLEDSTEPEEWEDRVRMREFLAVLFMEWGRRDIGGVEMALQDVKADTRDLAYPTALAGYSEAEPEAALDLLIEWRSTGFKQMYDSALRVATMHMGRRDTDAAWERVIAGRGSMEGLAAGLSDPQQMARLIVKLESVPPDNSSRDDWRLKLALGWARHDIPAAWGYYSQGDERNFDYGLVDDPRDLFFMDVGMRNPSRAMDFSMSITAVHPEGMTARQRFVVAGLLGALKSEPDYVLDRLLQADGDYSRDWIGYVVDSKNLIESSFETVIWPLQEDDRSPLPQRVLHDRILARLPDLGIEEDQAIDIREVIELLRSFHRKE